MAATAEGPTQARGENKTPWLCPPSSLQSLPVPVPPLPEATETTRQRSLGKSRAEQSRQRPVNGFMKKLANYWSRRGPECVDLGESCSREPFYFILFILFYFFHFIYFVLFILFSIKNCGFYFKKCKKFPAAIFRDLNDFNVSEAPNTACRGTF